MNNNQWSQNQPPNLMAQPSTDQQPNTTQFTDRDRMSDLLAMEKWICSGYNTACNEASHRELYDDWKRILSDHHECQYKIFETMYHKGWYKLKAADQQEVAQVHQNFTQNQAQIPRTW